MPIEPWAWPGSVQYNPPKSGFFETLIADSARRRRLYGWSGSLFLVSLTSLDDIDVDPPATEVETNKVARLAADIGNGRRPTMVLEVADGATAATTAARRDDLLLLAYREAAVEFVRVQLWWPRRQSEIWRWLKKIVYGKPSEREAALRGTGP